MNKNSFLKNQVPHLIALGIFLILACIYYSPTLSGKTLLQNDVLQSKGAMQEANELYKKTGSDVLWSNSAFGGMPVWLTYKSNILGYLHQVLTAVFPVPILL